MTNASSHPRLWWMIGVMPTIASVLVIAWGALVLIGWSADIEFLKSLLHPDHVAMNPATALCFVLCGGALFLLRRETVGTLAQVTQGFAIFVIVVGFFRLIGYWGDWNFGPDRVLFLDKLGPNVMAPNTALAFTLIGVAIFLFDVRTAEGFHAAQGFILATGCIALLALTGYIYQSIPLYGMSGFIPMALNTAICFALLTTGLLCARPYRQPVATLLDSSVGGIVARRLLPAAFLVPLLLGWLRLFGEKHGLVSSEFGLALLILSIIIVFNALVWWNAQIQRKMDRQRQAAESELRQSEQRHRAVVEQASEGITLVDAETLTIIEANHALARMLGYRLDELVGRPIFEFIVDSREGVQSRAQQTTGAAETGVTATITERRYRRKDGSTVDVEKSATVLNLAGRRVLCTVIHDITERKRAEAALAEKRRQLEEAIAAEREAHTKLKAAQSAMVQSEKLAGLGQMVAGVAHEINNPLAFVSNNVAVLQRDVRGMSELLNLYSQTHELLAEHRAELLNEIKDLSERMDLNYTMANLSDMLNRSREGLRRIQQIVKDLREFARLDAADLQEADLNAGIESTINIVRGVAKKKQVQLEMELQPLPAVSCFPAKVNQVIMNLVTNAIDACRENGKVTIRSERNGEHVRIEVTDDGGGIPPEIRPRIFDPFFTTKPVGQGTGLGLSISYGIIQDHGGTIKVESEMGKGTTFVVTLPLIPSRAKVAHTG